MKRDKDPSSDAAPEVQTLRMEQRQNADLKELSKTDEHRPSLQLVMWVEGIRYGIFALLGVGLIFILRPIWQPIVDFIAWAVESLFG